MDKEQVRATINDVGIVPAIRMGSAENARFAAETIAQAGIPIVEITMTVPGAIDVIADLVHNLPHVIVGAGTILDSDTARACLKAGAHFLTSPGLDLEIVQFAKKENILMMAGALTPTEVVAAYKAGSDFVKVFPCSQVGGDSYIKALKAPFPQIPLVAAGGVNQQTAGAFILAGASAVGVGGDLIPRSAIELRQPERIRELARRFLVLVRTARAQLAAWQAPARASGR
ncbi:MAG TPA: bifunctional 4-hydroxy-2-oxoglutarate aldolase/2-dehydro-3-deoxy-phosphogluconate aldolase [Candidatus Acidoferrum sp.]|jgi:2-dehydro-3-deoxyphosphogluconate aldolase/(4S)-4-hydroxy-2-oxoglutarate aldolase